MPQLPTVDKDELRNKLDDANEIFTLAEVYAAVDELAPFNGWRREDYKPPAATVQTYQILVDNFEHYGVITVKLLSVMEQRIVVPNDRDYYLTLNSSGRFLSKEALQEAYTNCHIVAMLKSAIVSPPGLVEKILQDPASDDGYEFLIALYREYDVMIGELAQESKKKRRSLETQTMSGDGSVSVSTSATGEISSPQVPNG